MHKSRSTKVIGHTYGSDADNAIEVMNVNMHEHAEQSRQNLSAQADERPWERHVGRHGENVLVVDLPLGPVHQQLDVLGRWQWRRLLVVIAVGPEVLVPRAARHRRTRRLIAVLGHRAVNEVDAVEKIDNCERRSTSSRETLSGAHLKCGDVTVHGDPVVDVLARRQFNDLPQIDARL